LPDTLVNPYRHVVPEQRVHAVVERPCPAPAPTVQWPGPHPCSWQAASPMTRPRESRRAFLKTSVALAGAASLTESVQRAEPVEEAGPPLAYVGPFSSPLRDVLPTQVDLPPGNGRGIHLFEVNRQTGEMTASGVHEMGTSPSCLALNAAGTRLYSANETDRAGDDKERTLTAFAVHP